MHGDEPTEQVEHEGGAETPTLSLSRDVTAVDLPSLLHAIASDPEKRTEAGKCGSSSPDDTLLKSLPYLPGTVPSPTEKNLTDAELDAHVPATLAGAEATSGLLAEDEDDGWTYPEGGRGWWVVIGCTIIAAVTLGWGLAWGVFQSYYKEHLFPGVPDSVLSVLGSIPGTVMNPIAFVVGKYADRYGYRLFIICGCITAFIAMLTAAFSTTLWQLFLTQGLLQGICTGLILPVAMAAPAQWFHKKRGLTSGIVIAGSSFGGGAASLVAQQLLTHLGLRYTLLAYAFLHAVLMSASVLMIRDRPHPRSARYTHAPIEWWDASLFRTPLFWAVAVSIFVTVFGYLGPYFYIEQYTLSQLPNLDPALLAVPAAVMNFSAALGRSTIGLLADRIGVLNAFIGSVFIAGCVQLLLWNFAHSFGVIIVFSIACGFFGAAFISLVSVLGAKLFGVRNLAALSGILMLFNMPGQAGGSPLVGAILAASGNNWHAPICFSGLCCVVGAFIMVPARLAKEKRIFAVY
ncbi:MFS general substrate transporter [Calocera cornea HHB12733]|uniref:MFS general substrate transporter n=1 Tax=Calocera cornea HHB12733 TaxID=1353952 RepID=A0A165EZY4_9BASI|nr:MFS general substrate transporter [Calocera cornea HHB12733]